MGAGATPAGWYPDVERPGGERYWDGSLWSEHRRDAAGAAGGPSSTPTPSTPPDFGQQNPDFGQQPPSYGQQSVPSSSQQPPSYGSPPGGGYGQPSPQPAFGSPAGYTAYGAAGSTYPPSQAAGWALGLSITGLVLTVCCGLGVLLAIPGAIMGWTTMKSIDRNEKNPDQRGMAKAAFVIGLVSTVLVVAGVLLWVIAIAASG